MQASPGGKKSSTSSYKRTAGWLFVAPSIVVIVLVTIFPTIYSLGLSFFQFEVSQKERPFIGLGNYIALFNDDRFIHSLQVTTILVVVGVSLELILGFALAHNLMGKMKGKQIFVAGMLLPVMVMPVVVGYTWKLMWDARYGPIDQVIGWIIGQPFHYAWLAQPSSAIFAILVTEIWQWTPFMFLVSYSGLTSLAPELLEAADIDGAGGLKKLWYVTIPLVRPILIVAILIRGLDALKTFDIVYTLTGGAPGTSTETISLYIYKVGYQFFRLGYGAAASFVFLIALAVLLTFLLKSIRSALQ